MTSPSNPFTATELQKLLGVATMSQVAKLALKAGNRTEDLLAAGNQAGFTRQGVYLALRNAGHRTRKVRSDKGLTLKRKIDRLMEQAKVLEAKLSQDSKSDPGQQ